MVDGPVEQGHQVLMPCTRAIIQRYKTLSRRYQFTPCHEWRVWRYLLGDQSSESLFHQVRHVEATAPTRQRQRGDQAETVSIPETVSPPELAVGDTTSGIQQQLDVHYEVGEEE